MSFLYFIPFESINNKQAVEADDFKSVGLGYALLPGAGIQSVALSQGPAGAGKPGVLSVVQSAGAPRCQYQPDRQTWRNGPGGKYAVGMVLDQRPGPEDLSREVIHTGQSVSLMDGRPWIIPRCLGLLPDRPSRLPYLIDLAEDGVSTIASPHPAFESISARAFEFWLLFRGAENAPKLTNGDLSELAVDALAINYRVGKLEVLALLKLLSEQERNLVLRAMIDADEIEAYFRAQAAAAMEPGGANQKKDT
jgi:hypothetical protein